MQTFRQGEDAAIQQWPQSPQEWLGNPEIKFTVNRDRVVQPGDRILMCTKMVKSGPNSGGIVDIFYYVKEVLDVCPETASEVCVTALAIRREL